MFGATQCSLLEQIGNCFLSTRALVAKLDYHLVGQSCQRVEWAANAYVEEVRCSVVEVVYSFIVLEKS